MRCVTGATGSKRTQRQILEDDTPSDAEIVPLTASQPVGASARFKQSGTAVVAGAGGGTGQQIVQRLIRDGVPVRALVRDIPKAVRLPMPSVMLCIHFIIRMLIN